MLRKQSLTIHSFSATYPKPDFPEIWFEIKFVVFVYWHLLLEEVAQQKAIKFQRWPWWRRRRKKKNPVPQHICADVEKKRKAWWAGGRQNKTKKNINNYLLHVLSACVCSWGWEGRWMLASQHPCVCEQLQLRGIVQTYCADIKWAKSKSELRQTKKCLSKKGHSSWSVSYPNWATTIRHDDPKT